MKQITCWYRQKETKGYYFNHYEDGHSTATKPTPRSEQQRWLKDKWLKRHTIMINTIIQ